MKRVLLIGAGVLFFWSCGESEEEQKKREESAKFLQEQVQEVSERQYVLAVADYTKFIADEIERQASGQSMMGLSCTERYAKIDSLFEEHWNTKMDEPWASRLVAHRDSVMNVMLERCPQ